MNSLKWFAVLSLSVAAAMLLSACGGAATAPANPVTIDNPPNTPEEVDAIDLVGKNVTVTYWHTQSQKNQDLLQSMLDEFNRSNPYGIAAKAEIAAASSNAIYSKVSTAILAGQPPEISVAYQNHAAYYRSSGMVIDLTPFIKSKKYGLSQDDLNDYFQIFLDSDANPQYQGERLGFPTQRSMEVLYYNVDWLKQLGYDAPPQDWKQFEEMACTAVDKDRNRTGWAYYHDASNFATLIFTRGGRILAEDGQSYIFDSGAGMDAVQMVQRMFKNGCAVEVPISESDGEQNRFANGEVLFVLTSSGALPFYAEAVNNAGKFTWDIAMPPNNDKPAITLYGASISVFNTTPEKELAAWLVIKFLGEKAQTTKWAAATGHLPVRKSAKDDTIAAFRADKQWGPVADSYAKMFDWVQYSMTQSPLAGYDAVRQDVIDKMIMSKAISDPDADARAMLEAAVKKADDILKENAPQQ